MVSIFKELSLRYCIPEPVIKTICQHPFMFASRAIADDADEKPIMFAYLGKLKLKKRYETKEDSNVSQRNISDETVCSENG